MRDLREDVRRAERQLAAVLGRDPDGPMSALRFVVAEAAARLRAAALPGPGGCPEREATPSLVREPDLAGDEAA